jgi:hypothetical protein
VPSTADDIDDSTQRGGHIALTPVISAPSHNSPIRPLSKYESRAPSNMHDSRQARGHVRLAAAVQPPRANGTIGLHRKCELIPNPDRFHKSKLRRNITLSDIICAKAANNPCSIERR